MMGPALFAIAQIMLFIAMTVGAIYAVHSRDLLTAVIALAMFSLLLSLEFYLLQAPDVAIAEAAIGAGLTTAIYIFAIKETTRKEEDWNE